MAGVVQGLRMTGFSGLINIHRGALILVQGGIIAGICDERIMSRAADVIGSREDAIAWLQAPVRALDDQTPLSLLVDAEGKAKVLAVLDNLQDGVL